MTFCSYAKIKLETPTAQMRLIRFSGPRRNTCWQVRLIEKLLVFLTNSCGLMPRIKSAPR